MQWHRLNPTEDCDLHSKISAGTSLEGAAGSSARTSTGARRAPAGFCWAAKGRAPRTGAVRADIANAIVTRGCLEFSRESRETLELLEAVPWLSWAPRL